MIDRKNYQFVEKYLKYRIDVQGVRPDTVRAEQTRLYHLLYWADARLFEQAAKIQPSFPKYLLTARIDGKDEPLKDQYIKKIIRESRRFFKWLKQQNGWGQVINQQFIDSLNPPYRKQPIIKPRRVATEEDIRAIANAPVMTIKEKRTKAAAIFLFLSGMRIQAFVTLPLEAFDISKREVKQHPNLGVETKNGKHATTYLLDIPDLIGVIKQWDDEVRKSTSNGKGWWFAPLLSNTGKINPNPTRIGKHRDAILRRNLSAWLKKVQLSHLNPHAFRHGHIVYGLKSANDVADYKAISQNVMHSSLEITDSVYGMLLESDVGKRISGLGKSTPKEKFSFSPDTIEEMIRELKRLNALNKTMNNNSKKGRDKKN